MGTLARAFALALGSDPDVRESVHRDLEASPFTAERKLHFQDYLGSLDGRTLLDAVAGVLNAPPVSVTALAQSVGDLEFYLPVPAHRARWQGDGEVIVATLPDGERADPVGYGPDGRRVRLSAAGPPTTPVISLVSAETDFGEPATGVTSGKGAVAGPVRTGTTSYDDCSDGAFECPGDGTGGGSGGSSPPGLYYTAADLDFVGEAWARGAPEIEVHALPYFDPDNYSYGGSFFTSTTNTSDCEAARDVGGARYFDQNDEQWTGSALVLDNEQLRDFSYLDENGDPIYTYVITLWEDDYRVCDLQTNIDVGNHIAAIAAGPALAYGTIAGISTEEISNVRGIAFLAAIAGSAVAISNSAWRLFNTKDEFLGVVVAPTGERTAPSTGTYPLLVNSSGQENGTVSLSIR